MASGDQAHQFRTMSQGKGEALKKINGREGAKCSVRGIHTLQTEILRVTVGGAGHQRFLYSAEIFFLSVIS